MPYFETLAVGRGNNPEGQWVHLPAAFRSQHGKPPAVFDPDLTAMEALAFEKPVFRLQRARKGLPDRIDDSCRNLDFSCSAKFRDALLSFKETGHIFFPMAYICPDGTSVPGDYFIYSCRNYVQAIVVEASPGMQWVERTGTDDPYRWTVKRQGYLQPDKSIPREDRAGSGLILARDRVDSHGAWKDPLQLGLIGDVFFSDELANALRVSRVSGFELNDKSRAPAKISQHPNYDIRFTGHPIVRRA